MALVLLLATESPGRFLTAQMPRPRPEILTAWVWCGAQASAFLTSSSGNYGSACCRGLHLETTLLEYSREQQVHTSTQCVTVRHRSPRWAPGTQRGRDFTARHSRQRPSGSLMKHSHKETEARRTRPRSEPCPAQLPVVTMLSLPHQPTALRIQEGPSSLSQCR